MKQIRMLLMIGMLGLVWACDEQKEPLECNSNIACTEIFITLTFAPLDPSDKPIILDSYYSQNLDNGNTYSFNNPLTPNSEGVYAVISDAQRGEIKMSGTIVRFFGEKDGEVIIEQDFVIGHDCCHVTLIQGPGQQD